MYYLKYETLFMKSLLGASFNKSHSPCRTCPYTTSVLPEVTWLREASSYLERSKCVSHLQKRRQVIPCKLSPDITQMCLCKVLEHIVASNLTKQLANSNILFELQHGFSEKRSCETQLAILVDEIAKTCRWGNKLIWYF